MQVACLGAQGPYPNKGKTPPLSSVPLVRHQAPSQADASRTATQEGTLRCFLVVVSLVCALCLHVMLPRLLFLMAALNVCLASLILPCFPSLVRAWGQGNARLYLLMLLENKKYGPSFGLYSLEKPISIDVE